jgi:hypothetical protein
MTPKISTAPHNLKDGDPHAAPPAITDLDAIVIATRG